MVLILRSYYYYRDNMFEEYIERFDDIDDHLYRLGDGDVRVSIRLKKPAEEDNSDKVAEVEVFFSKKAARDSKVVETVRNLVRGFLWLVKIYAYSHGPNIPSDALFLKYAFELIKSISNVTGNQEIVFDLEYWRDSIIILDATLKPKGGNR